MHTYSTISETPSAFRFCAHSPRLITLTVPDNGTFLQKCVLILCSISAAFEFKANLSPKEASAYYGCKRKITIKDLFFPICSCDCKRKKRA